MFLLRSVRRQLVLLLSLTLCLMLALAGIGLYALMGHREAVEDLDFVLYKSPNKDHLSRAVTRISESLFSGLDLQQPAAVELQRTSLANAVAGAVEELFEFRRRFEALPPTAELQLRDRGQVLTRLDQIYGDLYRLSALTNRLTVITSPDDQRAIDSLRNAAGSSVTQIQRTLDTLAAFQTHSHFELSLEKEQARTRNLLRALGAVTAVALIMFAIVLYCGLTWISGPARAVADGCTRIADGDTLHRLPPISPWNHEFSRLVAGVNMVADRFQQAEDELQERVREQSEQLFRTHRLAGVGFFAAGIAHEINNPLNAISLAADSIERCLDECGTPDAHGIQLAKRRVAMIRQESERCAEITRLMLNFSRGDKSDQKQCENVTELVREVLLVVEHLGKFQDRAVEFECERTVTAEISASQIKQVVLNLVINALQASPVGCSVKVRLSERVDAVILSVTDEGCGMDVETREHVFDPFFTKQEVGQGTGLGLSISHRIIEDHGGTILPMSDGPGLGSTFHVRLPRRQQQQRKAA